MTNEFDGLVAIVTGAASGIGAATCAVLADRGAAVAGLDIDADHVKPPASGIVCDVSDRASVATAVDDVVRRFGRIDVLVNNAGIGAVGTVADNADDEWHRVFDINVVGVARMTAAALPHLRRSPHASVVNTCSIAATIGLPLRALYSATKGALLSLTLAMAADHVGDGIRVNAVLPGTVDTPWVARLLDRADDPVGERQRLAARQPIGRLIDAGEVAHAIAYLASPLASSTTGTLLGVDGGATSVRLPAR